VRHREVDRIAWVKVRDDLREAVRLQNLVHGGVRQMLQLLFLDVQQHGRFGAA
jgi:hypothetical protein